MTTIPGASTYLNAATLANRYGLAAQAPTLLGDSDAASIIELGRNLLPRNGVGASSSARLINKQLLSRSSDINAMFSLGVGTDATVDGARQSILALRARLSDTQIAPSLRGGEVDTQA